MKQHTIAKYIVILCIIASIGYFNGSIIKTQVNKDTSIHNWNEHYQANQNNYLQHNIVTKTNNKLVNNQSVQKLSRKQSIKTVKANSNSTGFISTWQTNIISLGSSNEYRIKLPLVSDGIYDFNVLWGDGSSNLITAYNQPAVTHTYNTPGTYTVNITGTIVGWSFNGSGDVLKLIQISNWGPLRLGNAGYYFSGASNLILTSNDTLDLNGTTDLVGMFANCTSLGKTGNLNSWNVSKVTDMAYLFFNSIIFNNPLDLWNVSLVTNMSSMFAGASGFDQILYPWNVSKVTDMSNMFSNAYNFNQPLNTWNVSKVTDMSNMFSFATTFNQPLNSWNVSDVTNMSRMFSNAIDFNQTLFSWDVSHVTDMSSMFYFASGFNQSLDSWNVSHATNMSKMFYGATIFNQPLNSWNVSHVTDMDKMFYNANDFNQPLNSWNVSNVTDMNKMFYYDLNFNQPLNPWNVSQVTDMHGMFALASSFNQPLNSWNVAQVNDMSSMFALASSFNQPINSWNVSEVTDMNSMFYLALNFNQPLNSWNVSHVTDMNSMFYNAISFNQQLNPWNVAQVNDMSSMFALASSFNQPLNSWNVSHVTDMNSMFYNASSFNQPLNSWNVAQVNDMSSMFALASSFNQPLNSWNVTRVALMDQMFQNATSFNQPLGSWNILSVISMMYMFSGVSLSTSNYDELLLAWSSLPKLQHNVVFDAGNSQYSYVAQNAREKLVKNFGWTITDGGLSIISFFTELALTSLTAITIIGVIGISAFLSIAYFEYKKTKIKEQTKSLKFWNYVTTDFYFKLTKTFDKIIIGMKILSPISLLIGGIFAMVSVLPKVSDFLPLKTFAVLNPGGGENIIHGYVNFWGTSYLLNGKVVTFKNIPGGWTFLGISPDIMVSIFTFSGIIAIIIAVDGIIKLKPLDTFRSKSILGTIGSIVGFIDLLMVLLIYQGNSQDHYHQGFTPVQPGISIGLGFYFLFLSCILIIVGSIFNFVITKSKEQTNDNNDNYHLKNGANLKKHKTIAKETLSSGTFDKLEQIIEENKDN